MNVSKGNQQENSKNLPFKQKSHSYQDLHSDYTKKRYHHVKSKVKEYIANIKAYDRSKSKKIIRHRSLPETIGTLDVCDTIICESNSNHDSNEQIVQLLQEKEKEVEELKNLNKNLESNLQEKVNMLARTKMNADIMRIQMMEMQDKGKRHSLPAECLRHPSQRFSIPDFIPPTFPIEPRVTSIATQTECSSASNSEDFHDFLETNIDEIDIDHTEVFLNDYSALDESEFKLRRRSYSNSKMETANSVYPYNLETCPEDKTSAKESKAESTIQTEKNDYSNLKRKSRSRTLWRRCVAGPCKRVVLCCNHIPEVDSDYFYMKLPVEEMPLSPIK